MQPARQSVYINEVISNIAICVEGWVKKKIDLSLWMHVSVQN